MTMSIVARCPETGQFGVGAATAMPAVGKLLTHALAKVGAVATQAQLNPYLGIDGLALLREGCAAAEVRERLTATDPRIELRQFALVDGQGRVATWTGPGCPHWAGAREHGDFSVQGNRLTGPEVLEAMAGAYLAGAGRLLADRFLEALEAGAAAGGDAEGERSATIYIVDTEEYPLWDIRVDDHPDPIAELHRLHGVFSERLLPALRRMPTRANPAGEEDEEPA